MYDNHNRNHYPFYYTSCITLNSIRYKYPFASTLNALADFNTTHLDLLADISVKYHRTGSYADPIIPLQPSFFNPHIHSRHLCSTHPQLQSYMISHQCSTSWISAIQEAAEAAMLRHNQTVHFSFDFIKECAPIDDDTILNKQNWWNPLITTEGLRISVANVSKHLEVLKSVVTVAHS